MIQTDNELDLSINAFTYTGYKNEDIVFFDIETTGFSPVNTMVYLIGCIYFKDNRWHSISWFAENNKSEQELIYNFFEFIKNYKIIIHFNGEGFDMPYLLKKAAFLNLPYNFNNHVSIDIYKAVMPLKKLLKLDNLKQKTIEIFLGIDRDDKYNGGELISIYHHYSKYPNDTDYEKLMLHNKEDIAGLLSILPVLAYSSVTNKNFTVEGISLINEKYDDVFVPKTLCIDLKLTSSLPKNFSFSYHEYSISGSGNICTLKINIYTDELKYYYPNYKDYYYLPVEDKAIHKSVAFYVDKNFRTRAKAANCYSKKTGRFAPQYSEVITPYFKIDYYDTKTYFELTDDFLSNSGQVYNYSCHVIDTLLKGK